MDDLVVVSHALNRVAESLKSCLDIYANMTGQLPNPKKSEIFFPKWLNHRVVTRISSSLGFKVGKTLFKYLGISISPKKLHVSYFQDLVNGVSNRVKAWTWHHISPTGKIILINSVIMSLPLRYLAAFSIPKTIFDNISKVIRGFLWSKDSNRNGLSLIGLNRATMSKTKGGLAIRDLNLAKLALMSKNVFNYLNNNSNTIWVDILHLKYGVLHHWNIKILPKCSQFFRSLCKAMDVIRNNLLLAFVDFSSTNFFQDLWCFDIPISYKPCFLNMNSDFDNISVVDVTTNSNWDLVALTEVFGSRIDSPIYEKGLH